MKSHLYHLQVNIDKENLSFYHQFMSFMGWQVIFQDDSMAGFKSHSTGDLWFVPKMADARNNYDGNGVNHISLRVDSLDDVNKVADYLQKNGVTTLFETPRHRPEFASGEKETYYQVMFESPDKILFEVVYVGVK